jgi:hypothetical protein
MRRALLLWLLFLTACGAAPALPPPPRNDAPEAVAAQWATVKDLAWARALELATATDIERAGWRRPPTRIILVPRYLIGPGGLPVRLCGMTLPVYESDESGLIVTGYVEIYVRPLESKLIFNVLTHEYLHVVYLFRSQDVPDFEVKNPNSEAYVVGLLPNICPAL